MLNGLPPVERRVSSETAFSGCGCVYTIPAAGYRHTWTAAQAMRESSATEGREVSWAPSLLATRVWYDDRRWSRYLNHKQHSQTIGLSLINEVKAGKHVSL